MVKISSKSNSQLLKEYLDKYNLPYSVIQFKGQKDVIQIDVDKISKKHLDNLFKEL